LSRRKRNRLVLCIGLACCAVAAMIIFAQGLVERNLLRQATRVQSASAWTWYDWITNETVLVSQGNEVTNDTEVFNLRDGSSSRPPRTGTNANESIFPEDYLSPDKRNLCGSGVGSGQLIVNINGSVRRYEDVERILDRPGRFTRDSRYWITVRASGPKVCFNTISVTGVKSFEYTNIIANAHFAQPVVEGVLLNGDILVGELEGMPNPRTQITLSVYDLKRAIGVKILHIPLPRESVVFQTALSPSCRQLAFVTQDYSHMTGLDSLLERLHVSMVKHRLHLWVSDLEGHDLKCLGTQYVPLGYPEWPDAIQCLRWLPDGKSISFLTHSALWKMDTTIN